MNEKKRNSPPPSKSKLKFVSSMDFACPTAWTTSYASYHADVLAGHLPPRYLVHTCDSGFADCAVGAVTALYLAVLSRRALVIGRQSMRHFFKPNEPSAHLNAVFDQPSINWTLDSSRWKTALVSKTFSMAGLELQSQKVRSFLDEGACDDKSSEVFHLYSNAGLIHQLVHHPNFAPKLDAMGLTIENALGCGLDFLYSPKDAVAARMKSQMDELHVSAETPRRPLLAVHLRTGDAAVFRGRDHSPLHQDISGVVECIETVREHIRAQVTARLHSFYTWENQVENEPAIYIISDNLYVRGALKHRFPDATIKIDAKPEHSFRQANGITVAGLELAAGEFWMFRMADYHIITVRSGFGRAAAAAGPSHHSGWQINNHVKQLLLSTDRRTFQHSAWAKGCTLDDVLSLDDMVRLPPGV